MVTIGLSGGVLKSWNIPPDSIEVIEGRLLVIFIMNPKLNLFLVSTPIVSSLYQPEFEFGRAFGRDFLIALRIPHHRSLGR